MDLILFGIQGSGKGTQGKFLRERYQTEYFETGGQLRKLAKEDSPLGKKIKHIIEAGHLVSDDVVMEIVANFINNIAEGKSVIFDGIPRSIGQAKALDELLAKRNRDFNAVILDLSTESAMTRLTTRRICENCKTAYPATYKENTCNECEGKLITRTDDNADSIRVRLQAYADETMPVITRYENTGKLIHVDGEKDIEEVSNELYEKLDPIFK
ncbi:nucleoside monophosphate kinase [Patescibacteria group bacterium]|nr:nucleoside monophosphate kinase [Patescibacteria group bacterium]